MADKGSWSAVEKYAADPLCDDEEDDKKWKATLKEAKEELAKKKSSGYGYGNRNRGRDGYRSGYSGGRRDFRRDSKERREALKEGQLLVAKMFLSIVMTQIINVSRIR